MDRGETLTDAALRETWEEAGLQVRLDGLVNVYSYPGRPIVIIVYTASILAGELRVDEESLEARLFAPADIPWQDLAFQHAGRAAGFFRGTCEASLTCHSALVRPLNPKPGGILSNPCE